MRLREVYRYELEYRRSSVSTWLYALFLFLLAMWMFAATADGGGSGYANTPRRIAEGAALAGTMGLLVVAALFGDAAVRDVQSGMDALLFTAPLRKIDYLGGRFLAALTVNAVVTLAIPLGLVACSALMGRANPDSIGPLRILAFVQPYFLFVLPNLILCGTVLYGVGVLTRHAVPVYLAAIGIFICCVAALNAIEGSDNSALLLFSDPLGIQTLRESTKYWTASERNARLIGFPVALLLNRVVWLAVSAAILVLLHRRFKFAHVGITTRARKTRTAIASTIAAPLRPVEARVSGSFGFAMALRQTIAVARNSLDEVAGTRSFGLVLFACVGLTLLMGWNVGSTVFDTSTWPVTLLVGESVLSQRIQPIVYALVALYAGELVWKDRNANVDEIADATPVSESASFAGRFLALAVMTVMFLMSMMIGGLLMQALQGYYHFEIGLYLRMLALNCVALVLFAVIAMTIQVLVNHKYLGHMAVLLALLAQLSFMLTGKVRHHMLLYATDPGWTYSDMNGFGSFVKAAVWFKLYWAAFALLLAVITILFSARGREVSIRRRLVVARERFAGPTVRAGVVAVVLIATLGGFVFYNTNILNEYRTDSELAAPRARYEQRYGRFVDAPQPTITNADLRVEIYPGDPAIESKGNFRLVNRTASSIDSVHVMFVDAGVSVRSISFDREAKVALSDDEAQYRIYALGQALKPGDSLQLTFDVTFRPRGFSNDRSQKAVVANGTKFNRSLLPFIGYQPYFELSSSEERARFGLKPKAPTPSADDAQALQRRERIRDADMVQVKAIIGTSDDQTAITSGALKRTWVEKGRRYFEYETRDPISFGFATLSARYALREDRWNDVPLQIFHHPEHKQNLDRMVKSMKASLEYFSAQFGPYPDNQLRIVEAPRYGGFGAAHPNLITFTEDFFLSRVNDGEIDQPFYGTAHEIAHTWWGGAVHPANVKGEEFLSESAANYSAMMVTEKTFGLETARRVYDFQMERYLTGRANQSREVAVLDVDAQPYIAYRKGALALYTLRDHISEEAVNSALRRFQEKHRNEKPPYATAKDLYAELRAVTPDSMQSLLVDWFETVTLWNVKAESATVEKTSAGDYAVTLSVVAKKIRADSVGNEAETPMDDWVEIGVFAKGKGENASLPMYLKRHRIKSGRQTIRITVPQEPSRAGIDPYRKLIDRVRDDNVVAITQRGSL